MTESDYLWDRSGRPDPEIERLESSLAVFSMRERPLDWSRAREPKRLSMRAWRIGFAFAAVCVVLIAALAYSTFRRVRSDWQFVVAAGTAQVDGRTVRRGVLRVGQSLANPEGGSVRLRVGNIGDVVLTGDTRVRLLETGERRQRLALEYGALHARISAPPAVFVVDTASARAIDLGCEYDLNVGRDGTGSLRVSAGWVQLDYGARQTQVPQGAEARIASRGRITPAYFLDAAPAFRSALARFALEDLSAHERLATLRQVLSSARQRDALTLLNLFRISEPDERAMIFDRLNALVPAPADVDREGVIAGDLGAAGAWWPVVIHALGLEQIKKKGPLNLTPYTGMSSGRVDNGATATGN